MEFGHYLSTRHVLRGTESLTLRPWILVHRTVCPFTPQISLVIIAPTYGRMARLSLPECDIRSLLLYVSVEYQYHVLSL